jgi:ATP phosphoribosyltransferase regulatory subunit
MHASGLNPEQESSVFDMLQRKAVSELKEMFSRWDVPSDTCQLFIDLIDLNGDVHVLSEARQQLKNTGKDVLNCLDAIEQIADSVSKHTTAATLNFDLAELRGYHYHTGAVFTAYVPGRGQGIAFGGRYDAIGQAFGRARPATGFSTDIKCLLSLQPVTVIGSKGIFVPFSDDPDLLKQVNELRQSGEIVISELPDQIGGAAEMNCDRKLELRDGNWKIVKL